MQKAASSTDGVKSVRPAEAGRWEVEATRDVRPDLARLVVQGGGSLRNLDLRRARLDQAYNRYFREVADAA